MKKNLLALAFVLASSSFVLAEDKIDYDKPFDQIKEDMSSFENRHSLMPRVEEKVQLSPVVSNPDNGIAVLPLLDGKPVDSSSPDNSVKSDVKNKVENVDTPVQIKAMSKEAMEQMDTPKTSTIKNINKVPENLDVADDKPVEIVPMASVVKEEAKVDAPVIDKPEGYDELMKMAKEQGGVIKPSNYKEDMNGNLVLAPETKEEVKVVSSPVIEEKKEDVVNKPLFNSVEEKAQVQEVKPVAPVVETTKEITPVKYSAPLLVNKEISNNVKEDVKPEVKPVSTPVYKTDVVDRSVKTQSEEKPYQSIAHIASYKTEDSAKKGIGVITSKYPRANMFETYIHYEYVDGKGNFYRLYFLGDRRELEYLCREMKANGDWCNILK